MQKYRATKKDVAKGVAKYMATTIVGHKVDNLLLAKELSVNTSLNITDVLAVIEQLPEVVSKHLGVGGKVHIKGLGSFQNAITSDLMDTPEEVTPERVRFSKIAFKADASLRTGVANHLKTERIE